MKKLFLCIFLLASVFVHAQPDTITPKLTRFVKNIDVFNKQYPQEKVYLHFDNTGYYLGETIWFKAYVVTAEEHLPTTLSRVLYVELLNPEGDVVITKKLKVENGQCHGDFQLKDSLFAGYYEVRAYTRYMLNFGKTEFTAFHHPDSKKASDKKIKPSSTEDNSLYPYAYLKNTEDPQRFIYDGYHTYLQTNMYLFERPVTENECVFSRVFPVYNTPASSGEYFPKAMRERPRIDELVDTKSKIQPAIPFQLTFYPEGGCLVTGLSSKLSFKAQSNEGENISVKGVVKNSKGEDVASLETTHDGMGSFELTPDGSTYTAEVYYKAYVTKIQLPKSEPTGYVMSVNAMRPKLLLIEIKKNEPISKELAISISCRGKVAYADTLSVKADEPYLLSVPKELLTTGVNQITLFGANGEVLADRLVFINHQEYQKVSLKASGKKELYQPHELVTLDFQLSDSLHASTNCSFSLAVRDALTEDSTYPADNVLTNFLLSSDLKGYIANPSFYFESNDNQHRYALDLLMLTQGWRRYAWKEMTGLAPFKLKEPLEKAMLIEGTIRQFSRKSKWTPMNQLPEDSITTVPNTLVNLSFDLSLKEQFVGQCKTDSAGRFKISMNDFYGVGQLRIGEFKGTHFKFYRTSLFPSFSPIPQAYTFYQTNVPYLKMNDTDNLSDQAKNEDNHIKTVTIKEVTVSAKRKQRSSIDFAHPTFKMSYADVKEKTTDLLYRGGYGTAVDYGSINISFFGYACICRGLGNAQLRWVIDENEDDSLFYSKSKYGPAYSGWNSQRLDWADSIYIYTDVAKRSRYAPTEGKIGASKLPLIVILTKPYRLDIDTVGNPEIITDRNGSVMENRGYKIQRSKKSDKSIDSLGGVRHFQGYSYVREFYSPDYKNNALPEIKDFRRTLYWDPDVKADNNGKARVSFYNNSTCKRINISAETVTNNGVPVVVNN